MDRSIECKTSEIKWLRKNNDYETENEIKPNLKVRLDVELTSV